MMDMHEDNERKMTRLVGLLDTRNMTKKTYYWTSHFARRIIWLAKNHFIPVQGRTDRQLAEAV